MRGIQPLLPLFPFQCGLTRSSRFSANNTARLWPLFKRLIGCCLGRGAISKVSVTAEKVWKQGRGETIVTVTNWLLQLNWDCCGFQAQLSITAASINGVNLNDKTISHEQAISLSSGQKLFECNSVWMERLYCTIWILVLLGVAGFTPQSWQNV